MRTTDAVLLAGGLILALMMLVFYGKSGKPIRAFFGTAIPGVVGLVVVNYASFFTGVGLVMNPVTLFTTVFLGLPGLVGLFLLKMIWGL